MRKPTIDGSFHLSLALALTLAAAACAPSTPELRDAQRRVVSLPEGDVDAGRAAFQRSGCTACHRVEGEQFPPPTTDIPTGVVLGSAWDREWTAQEIATAILDPSHDIASPDGDGVVTSGDLSRMGRNLHIEVGDLLDIVAFLGQVNRDHLGSKTR